MKMSAEFLSIRHIKVYTWAQFILWWGLIICFIPEAKELLQAITQVVTQFAGWIFFKST